MNGGDNEDVRNSEIERNAQKGREAQESQPPIKSFNSFGITIMNPGRHFEGKCM